MLYLDYEVVYYVTSSGKEPVIDYIKLQSKGEQIEILQSVHYLKKNNGRLLAPYTKHIFKKIWELRVKYTNRHHRIFYFIATKRKIVLLSAFLKKSTKTPQAEIKKAYKYYLDYLLNTL